MNRPPELTSQVGEGRRILVVDDGLVTQKLLERKLFRLGFEVECVGDGIHALERARSSPPSAVITDLNMPNLDGFGLCRAIRQDLHLSSLVVIATSACEVDESIRQRALQAGANTFAIRTPGLDEVIFALLSALRD